MDVDGYCRDKVAAEGTTLYYSLMFTAAPERHWLTAVRALGEELREVTDHCSDVNVGRSKLGWWHEECRRAIEGQPRHPVTTALVARGSLESALLTRLLEGTLKRLEAGGAPGRRELEAMTATAYAPLGALAASGCAGTDPNTRRFAENIYAANAQAWIARNPRAHGWRSFSYLPADALARSGISREHMHSPTTGDALASVVKDQVSYAREALRQSLASTPDAGAGFVLSAVTEARIELAILDRIAARRYRVLERPIMITPIRKLWIAWRAARKIGVA